MRMINGFTVKRQVGNPCGLNSGRKEQERRGRLRNPYIERHMYTLRLHICSGVEACGDSEYEYAGHDKHRKAIWFC